VIEDWFAWYKLLGCDASWICMIRAGRAWITLDQRQYWGVGDKAFYEGNFRIMIVFQKFNASLVIVH
jgi:hypothetical protein